LHIFIEPVTDSQFRRGIGDRIAKRFLRFADGDGN
jgi:hypothetical protein